MNHFKKKLNSTFHKQAELDSVNVFRRVSDRVLWSRHPDLNFYSIPYNGYFEDPVSRTFYQSRISPATQVFK